MIAISFTGLVRLAEQLQLRLHSAGELVARAADNGLVERRVDPDDGRRILVVTTSLES